MIDEAIQRLGIRDLAPPVENPGGTQSGPLGEVTLPDELVAIYQKGDRLQFEKFPGRMIPFEVSQKRNHPAFERSVYDAWPFFLCDDLQSDEVAVIVHGPAKGFVMIQAHDGTDRMLAPDVATFFESLVENPPSTDVFDYDDEAWIYPRALTPQDRAAVEELLGSVDLASDPYEGESFAVLAMSMMDDDEFVDRFGSSLFSIPNFRAVIWGRLLKIDSDAARASCALYQADYEKRSK